MGNDIKIIADEIFLSSEFSKNFKENELPILHYYSNYLVELRYKVGSIITEKSKNSY